MVIDASPDRDAPLLHIEGIDDSQATVYLLRPMTADIRELGRLTSSIPRSARLLRVQLRAAQVDQYTMNALRWLIRIWRDRGNVHLVLLSDSEARDAQECARPAFDPEWSSPAATAAFL